ncbi:hypothetical protein HA051_08230 [Chromobacterium vaccinii]|nr:hypothetical protein [Chromobacterium vaccinii]
MDEMDAVDSLVHALRNSANAIKSSHTEDSVLSMVVTGAPAISRDQLAILFDDLATKIAMYQFSLSEIDTKVFVRLAGTLTAVVSNNAEYMWGGVVGAGGPYVSSIFESYLACKEYLLNKYPKMFAVVSDESELYSVDELTEALDGYEGIRDKLARIKNASDEMLHLDLNRQQVNLAVGLATQRAQEAEKETLKIKGFVKEIEQASETATNSTGMIDEILDKCYEALRESTNSALAGSFTHRAHDLKVTIRWWIAGLISALLAGALIGYFQIDHLSTVAKSENQIYFIFNVALALLSMAGPVWVAWLSTKQINERFRLAEDYSYKAAVSIAYEGYVKEAEKLGWSHQDKLFNTVLSKLDEHPLRYVGKRVYGSPLHELLEMDATKDLVKSLPKIIESVKEKIPSVNKGKVESGQEEKKKRPATDNEEA